jgi:hypothetical protein
VGGYYLLRCVALSGFGVGGETPPGQPAGTPAFHPQEARLPVLPRSRLCEG